MWGLKTDAWSSIYKDYESVGDVYIIYVIGVCAFIKEIRLSKIQIEVEAV